MDDPIISYAHAELLRQEHVVLTDVCFDVRPGEFVYLIGPVGSGKSTLLKSLYAEVPVAAGQARVYNYDLRSLPRKQIPYLRRRLGIVFQDFQLLADRSVHDNLDFVLQATGWPDSGARRQRIAECLGRVGMEHKAYKFPHELSGGEQQRVVIARALLNEPRLILADEPTGNLDPVTGMHAVEQLRQIAAGGVAVVMATHNLMLLEQFPARVLSIDNKHLTQQ